jgi:DNA-binding HxlR family transcriptional regulator
MPVSKKESSLCPIDAMLSVIDGRWKGTILWRLSEGPMRTSELRRSIPEITERMLIRHLHELTDDGIVIRRQERAVPPCVRYSISNYGADTCAGFGGDLRMGTASFAAYRKDEPSAFPFGGLEQISDALTFW